MLQFPFKTPIIDRNGGLHIAWERALRYLEATYGRWIAVPYLAATYSASGSMTWTVEEADQVTLSYTQAGKRLEVAFVIRAAVVGGVASTTLQIALPGRDASGNARVAARDFSEPAFINDNGTPGIGVARVTAGASVIAIQRADGGNWSAGANGVEGRIVMEVQ